MSVQDWTCSVCGVAHRNTGCAVGGNSPPLNIPNPLDPLTASCEIESLRKKLDAALLQNGEWKLLAGSLLQRVHDQGLHQTSIQFCEEPTCKAAMARLSGKTEKPKTDFDLAICGWCAGTGEMQNRSECPKCKGHGSKVIEKPFDDLRPIKLPETPGTIPFVDRDKPKRELGPGNLCPKCLVKMDAEGWCGCDPTKA